MGSAGRKALIVVLLVAMLGAVGVMIYASKQAALARDDPDSHAAQIERAARMAEHAFR